MVIDERLAKLGELVLHEGDHNEFLVRRMCEVRP